MDAVWCVLREGGARERVHGRVRTIGGLGVEEAVDEEEGVEDDRLGQVLLARQPEAEQVVAQVVAARDARHRHGMEDGRKDLLWPCRG